MQWASLFYAVRGGDTLFPDDIEEDLIESCVAIFSVANHAVLGGLVELVSD